MNQRIMKLGLGGYAGYALGMGTHWVFISITAWKNSNKNNQEYLTHRVYCYRMSHISVSTESFCRVNIIPQLTKKETHLNFLIQFKNYFKYISTLAYGIEYQYQSPLYSLGGEPSLPQHLVQLQGKQAVHCLSRETQGSTTQSSTIQYISIIIQKGHYMEVIQQHWNTSLFIVRNLKLHLTGI